jgi:hypothetical protein
MDGIGDGPNGMPFDMPMLMNQQTPLFGAYGHDGSPVTAALPNPSFHDDPSMGLDDNNDPKRRRIARVSVPLVKRTAQRSYSTV